MNASTPADASPPSSSLWKSSLPSALLVAADVIGYSLAWQGAYQLRRALNPLMGPINELGPYLLSHKFMVAVGLANCLFFGLYATQRRLSSLNSWSRLLRAGYHYLLYLMVVGYFLKELDLGRSVILFAGVLGFAWLYASRTMFRWMKSKALAAERGRVRAAIVGVGKLGAEVAETLRLHPDIGFEIVGFLRHPSDKGTEVVENGLKILGGTEELPELVRRHGIEEIFVAAPHLSPAEQLNLINLGSTRGLRVQLVSNLFGVIAAQAKVDEISQFPVITLRDGRLPWAQRAAKRTLDVVVAAVGGLLWLLLFHWWIALWIRRDSPGPVFFRQERVGRDGERFTLLKYRTMKLDAEAYAVSPTSERDPRVTRAGRWLRKTSLDELPQLWNVLRGDMSMVGPRPEMPFIVDKYEEWQKRRLDVKPGVTGLWQVIGRKNLPLHLNMEYDFYYIRNQSLLLDIEILIRTVPAVLKGKGAF